MVMLPDHPDMTIAVYHGHKTTQQHHVTGLEFFFSFSVFAHVKLVVSCFGVLKVLHQTPPGTQGICSACVFLFLFVTCLFVLTFDVLSEQKENADDFNFPQPYILSLTFKVSVITAADGIHKYFFIVLFRENKT